MGNGTMKLTLIALLFSLLAPLRSSGSFQHDLQLGLEAIADAGRGLLTMTRQNNLQSLGALHTFMRAHNKTYNGKAEYKKRYRIFRSNMKLVERLQAEEVGSALYGPTHLADLSPEEFKAQRLGSEQGGER